MTATSIRPLEIPDTAWAARLCDAIHTMDGARDSYSITIQVSNPDLAIVRIWTKNHRDAEDAVLSFRAQKDATAEGTTTDVWVRHYPDGPAIKIITARPTPTTTVAATGVAA